MNFPKKNSTLLVGLSIMALAAVLTFGSVCLPRLLFRPKYDFLFASYTYVGLHDVPRYLVQDGKLISNKEAEALMRASALSESRLFVYDVSENVSREITFEEAQHLDLDVGSRSPDGFEIVPGTQRATSPYFFFFPFRYLSPTLMPDYHCLSGHGTRWMLNSRLTYFDMSKFIGWIR